MLSPSTISLFRTFFLAYPVRSAVTVALLALGGLVGGVGLVTLLPLFELLAEQDHTPSAAATAAANLLGTIGIPVSVLSLLAILVLTITLKAVLLWAAARQVGFTVAGVTRDLRLRLMRALIRTRWSYFSQQASGEIASSMGPEAMRAAWAYREACSVIADVLQISSYVLVAALISWRATVMAVMSGGALLFGLARFVSMTRDAGEDQTALTRSLTRNLIDILQGMKPIKAMGEEDLVLPILEADTEALNLVNRKLVGAVEGRRMLHEPLATLSLAIMLYVMTEVAGQPISSVVILALLAYRILQHLNTLQGRFQSVAEGESAYASLMSRLRAADAAAEITDSGTLIPAMRDSIQFKDVTFGYGSGTALLRGVNLTVPRGRFITISGPSGTGKTTLLDLLVRFQSPDSGEILVDGFNLNDLNIATWRRSVGYVPQDPLLLSDSFFRNVTLGDVALTETDVSLALQQAGALDFVLARPDGLSATVGERGTLLSGGQRQRIAIARALVRKPSVLILDEVTTALDPVTEQEICKTLRGLAGGVTILAISHQPALAAVADQSYILFDGKLESTGLT